ncbi:preprotein translocase subunit SecB [Rhodovulum iodosum]|uniref:Protein-export protein SecB n=1 Tax=Rhodovulum iodosum TaxID=68291 RepID=A0ABV3XUE7_9RHOB|nr:protein-export chaperone SecB [Rhodovulum robiginosum]RSK30316.1 protein-export chaperone SecB [Rhodovulum robiginosum]
MTDTDPNGSAAADQPQQVKMQVLGQFIRDMSFENMLVRKNAGAEVTPDVQVQVGLDARKRPTDHQYEVISKYTIRSNNKADQAPLFLMELEYGGVFHIENVPEEQLHPFLLIECPRLLFPFVRRIVSDVTRDGGFPPLNLDMVDFVQLYRQELARRAEAQKPAAENSDA